MIVREMITVHLTTRMKYQKELVELLFLQDKSQLQMIRLEVINDRPCFTLYER